MKNNTNFKEQLKKVKIQKRTSITSYEKTFSSFADGIEEMREVSEVIRSILGDKDPEGEPITIDQAAEDMVEAFCNHFPSIEKNEDVMWSINVSSSRCILKTGERISFGWKFKYTYNRDEHTTEIENIDMQVTLFGDLEEEKEVLERLGWAVKE